MFHRIEKHNARRVVIDALGDLRMAAGDNRRFSNYMYALTQEFAARQITALMIIETAIDNPLLPMDFAGDVSFLSDNTVQLSMDFEEDLVRWIRVIKSRGSVHDGSRHLLRIGQQGIVVE
jgi:circadian clock protein KaiC